MIYELIGFVFVFIYTAIRYNIFRFPISWGSYVEQGGYAFPLGLAKSAAELTQRLDQFFIVGRFSPATYAVYSQGAYPMRFFQIPHQSLFDIVIPQVVTLVAEERRQELIKFWRDLVFKLGVITIPIVILSQIVGTDAMVFLFTEQYRFSGHLFQLYVLVLLKYIPAFAVLPRSYARTGLILKSNIISLATMLVLGLPGTIYLGIWGTVSAMLVSQYVHAYIQMWQGRRDIDLPWIDYLPWKQLFQALGVAIIAGIPPALMCLLINTISGRLAVNIPLYAIGYLGLLQLTGVYRWLQDPIIRKLIHRYLPFITTKKNDNI
jgi:O-antigen/teichoic acid export membrane protein